MRIPPGHDECRECGMSLPNENPHLEGAIRTPCPHCGSTKRVKSGECNITAAASVSVDASLIIGWQEVDRLLAKEEFAAALLVAAVNVEFILWENLRRFAPAALDTADNDIKSDWGQVRGNKPEAVSLGSLLRMTRFFNEQDNFTLTPTWDPLVSTMNELRRKIAHERGYFAELTKLKDTDWPKISICQVLEDAKKFCHGNTP